MAKPSTPPGKRPANVAQPLPSVALHVGAGALVPAGAGQEAELTMAQTRAQAGVLTAATDFNMTYYVKNGGNDNADGLSDSTAWSTLAKVTATSFSPGDTICFRRGDTWNERLGLSSNGEDGAPITYTNYGAGALPTFYGTTAVSNSGWTDDGGGKYHKDIGSTVCIALYEDGYGLPQATGTDLSSPASGPRWFHSGTTVYYAPTTGTPADHTLLRLSLSTGIYAMTLPLAYVTLDGLRLWHSSSLYMVASATLDGGGWHHITVENCCFEDQPQGIWSAQRSNNMMQYITIRNNTFINVGYACYVAIASPVDGYNNDNFYLGYNTVTGANRTVCGEYWNQTGDRDGLGFQNISNTIIEHNDVSGGAPGAGGIGIWNDYNMTVDFTGNVVRYNYLHNLDNHGIYWDAGTSPASEHSVDIYYNLIVDFANTVADGCGIRLNSRQTASGSTVSNNTIYDGGYGIMLNSGPDYYRIRNNIVASMTQGLARANVVLGNNVLSNNLYAGGDSGTPFSISGTAKTWAQWVAAYGEANSLTSDPSFVTPGTDFHLQAGSPAINAGTDVGLAADYAGTPISGNPDLGAYEST